MDLDEQVSIEGSIEQEEITQYIKFQKYSDIQSVLSEIVSPELTTILPCNNFLKSTIFSQSKKHAMDCVFVKKYRTPEKFQKLGLHWKHISKEERLEHAAFKWFRNKREQGMPKKTKKQADISSMQAEFDGSNSDKGTPEIDGSNSDKVTPEIDVLNSDKDTPEIDESKSDKGTAEIDESTFDKDPNMVRGIIVDANNRSYTQL